jgi:hypothetical protein
LTALPGVAVRRFGPRDAELFNLLSGSDNLFDEDPSVAPSGALMLDGARALLASMEHWMAEQAVTEVWVPANTCAAGFYRKSGFTPVEGEILVKELH